jgi:thioredoxin reductase (NADPH)
MEAMACGDGPVVIVGGGNSAGQAALFLGSTCAQVYIAIRGPSLATSMSRYLIDQIERLPHIQVIPHTQVTALIGKDELERVELLDAAGRTSTLPTKGLFVFIGAQPATDWLEGQLAVDSHGFLLTGTSIPVTQLDSADQAPLFLETSRPGIFCVGDVRSGSVKRVATAIGEGSMAVRLVFERLQATGTALSEPQRVDS